MIWFLIWLSVFFPEDGWFVAMVKRKHHVPEHLVPKPIFEGQMVGNLFKMLEYFCGNLEMGDT